MIVEVHITKLLTWKISRSVNGLKTFPRLKRVNTFKLYQLSDEIIDELAAAKTRKLCL